MLSEELVITNVLWWIILYLMFAQSLRHWTSQILTFYQTTKGNQRFTTLNLSIVLKHAKNRPIVKILVVATLQLSGGRDAKAKLCN